MQVRRVACGTLKCAEDQRVRHKSMGYFRFPALSFTGFLSNNNIKEDDHEGDSCNAIWGT